ncbi:MAG: hypothetical protein ACJ76Z_03310 [Thermoleophilaceae bacterium]
MSIVKKMFGLSAAVVVAALAFGASSAFASDTAACQFSGLAGALVPPIPALANDPGRQATIETGTYHFAGSATCVKTDTDAGESGNSGVFPVNITSDGNYTNSVCGTGTADSTLANTSVISSTGDPKWEGPVNAGYHIDFTGGNGKLNISQLSNSQRTGGSGNGYVNIVPTNGGDCVLNDVAFFQVTGAFEAAG